MQLRRAELPRNSHRQRLAAPAIAKALRGLFLNLSREENCVAMKRMILAQKATTFRNGKFAIISFRSYPLRDHCVLRGRCTNLGIRGRRGIACASLTGGRENEPKSILMLLPSRWCVARELNFSGST